MRAACRPLESSALWFPWQESRHTSPQQSAASQNEDGRFIFAFDLVARWFAADVLLALRLPAAWCTCDLPVREKHPWATVRSLRARTPQFPKSAILEFCRGKMACRSDVLRRLFHTRSAA